MSQAIPIPRSTPAQLAVSESNFRKPSSCCTVAEPEVYYNHRQLGTRQSTAGLLVTSVGFLRGHEPLWFERTLYRGDAYEFHNRLGGIQPAGEPFGRFLAGQ